MVNLTKLGVVFRREYLERVRSKWFLIGTLLGPVFFFAVAVAPALISMRQRPGTDLANVVVLDATTSGLGARVGDALGKVFPRSTKPRVRVVTPDKLASAEDTAVLDVVANTAQIGRVHV